MSVTDGTLQGHEFPAVMLHTENSLNCAVAPLQLFLYLLPRYSSFKKSLALGENVNRNFLIGRMSG